MVGVQGTIVRTAQAASDTFSRVLEDVEVGIIIITERIAELIRPQVDRYVFSERFPLIVEIPDREGKLTGRPAIREMVNAAIGIKL
jgi:V/A-type H+-transporting ATPase subunit F